MMSEMFSLSTAVRTTLTNDRMRKLFRVFLISHLQDFVSLYKYGKLKGWEEIPPAYKTTKQVENEPIATGEAWHIWHNLNDRYLQSELSQHFLVFAHDSDFKAVLTIGTKALRKQIKEMEQVALKYEVPLPERPPASLRVSIEPESFEDKFMYKIIYKGIDDSIDMHIRGVIDILRNDALRKMFLDIYSSELNIQDNYFKLGKMKGWASVPPIYVEPT